MRTEALRLLGGVLALRRFTVTELMSFSHVKRATASSWLNRRKDLFHRESWKRPSGRGRPDMVFALKPDRVSELQAILSQIAAPDLETAFGPREGRGRLDALDRADRVLATLSGQNDPSAREMASDWFSAWVSAARRQADDLTSAGLIVDARDAERLVQFESFARALPGAQPPKVDVSHIVLESARRCVALVEDAEGSSVSGRAFERIVADEILGSGGPLALVAALGIMSKMRLVPQARTTMCRLAQVVSSERYASSVRDVFDLAEKREVDERALVAVLTGARRQEVLGSDTSFTMWIETVASRCPWSAPVLGAMLMIQGNGPAGRLTELTRLAVVQANAARRDAWYRAPVTGTDPFDRAVIAIVRESADYGAQVRMGKPDRRSTGIERFLSLFAPDDVVEGGAY